MVLQYEVVNLMPNPETGGILTAYLIYLKLTSMSEGLLHNPQPEVTWYAVVTGTRESLDAEFFVETMLRKANHLFEDLKRSFRKCVT